MKNSKKPYAWFLILLLAILWLPFYNRIEPTLFGLPFFYWYQLLLIPSSALLTWIIYRRVHPRDTGQK